MRRKGSWMEGEEGKQSCHLQQRPSEGSAGRVAQGLGGVCKLRLLQACLAPGKAARLWCSRNASHQSTVNVKVRWQCEGGGHASSLTDAGVGCYN